MSESEAKTSNISRLDFDDDEKVFTWLKPLLDSFHIADIGIDQAIRVEVDKGRTLACARGCSSCCRAHEDIPVFPLELVGMTWYATEKVSGETRSKLMAQLQDHNNLRGCPFLVDDVCSIHPLRPLACRHFNVFDKVCEEGEDAFHTRREDVLTPIDRFREDALLVTIPFYGNLPLEEQKQLVQSGSINKLARAMKDCQWESVASKMQAFDEQDGGE